jgi:hypothetical protein
MQVTSEGKPLSRALLPTLIRPGRGGKIKSFGSELKLKISQSASKVCPPNRTKAFSLQFSRARLQSEGLGFSFERNQLKLV